MKRRLNKPFKVLLCIPMAYDRIYPPLGTPALTGFLKSKGIEVRQMDLNIEFFEYARKNRLDFIFSDKCRDSKIKKHVYYWRDLQYIGENAPAYYFETVPGCGFDFAEKMLSSEHLLRYVEDQKENILLKFFKDEVFPKIKKEQFDMIGFSITAPSQAIASFTFGRFIKKELPTTPIVIGGQWVSLFREELVKRNDFSLFYDYAIYFEGETPLYQLIDSLIRNKPLSSVPNLIYKAKNKFVISRKTVYEDMDSLPCPDFDGLPLKKYSSASNGKICHLTFEASRGCYWNKCIFCVDLPTPKPRYRQKDIGLVLKDIKALKQKYKVKTLIISSAVFSPWQMEEFSKELIKQRIKIKWWAWTRFEKEFTKKLLSLAKKAGCSKLGFGLESINQRVLDFCEKGTRVEVIKRTVKDAAELKLDIFYQVMLGLPGEDFNEALDTLFFLLNNANSHSRIPTFNTYYLIPKNRVFENPGRFGIEFSKDRKMPFRFYYPFRHILGNIDREKADKLRDFYELLKKRKADNYQSLLQ